MQQPFPTWIDSWCKLRELDRLALSFAAPALRDFCLTKLAKDRRIFSEMLIQLNLLKMSKILVFLFLSEAPTYRIIQWRRPSS